MSGLESLRGKRVLFFCVQMFGIEKDIIKKIFEPYFTTKKYKKSSGLGLFLSKIIIEENMQGKLEFENASEGAKFIITIPILEESK